jgi:hypothetical protein
MVMIDDRWLMFFDNGSRTRDKPWSTRTRDREAVLQSETRMPRGVPKSETRIFTVSSGTTNESENDENKAWEFAILKTLTKTKIDRAITVEQVHRCSLVPLLYIAA